MPARLHDVQVTPWRARGHALTELVPLVEAGWEIAAFDTAPYVDGERVQFLLRRERT